MTTTQMTTEGVVRVFSASRVRRFVRRRRGGGGDGGDIKKRRKAVAFGI
jgi:hypothetical protein